MVMLIAITLVLIDKKIGYMSKFSKTPIGKLCYGTNKKLIVTTVISLIILVSFYGVAVPLGVNRSLVKIVYNVFGGIIIALGLSQERFSRKRSKI